MPVIRIDDEVWTALQKRAEPLVDTPNDVLRRLLDLAGKETAPMTGTLRSRRGELFPRRDFYTPVLRSLVDHGGRARAEEVLQNVYHAVQRRLNDLDRQPHRSGEPTWRNSARWAKEMMAKVEDPPLLNPSASFGWWEITEAGRDYLTRHRVG